MHPLHEYLFLPLGDLLTGQQVWRDLRFVHHSEQWSDVECEQFQIERLRQLIDFATLHVPFYRQWIANNGGNYHGINNLNDLRQLPVVDKRLMQTEGIECFISNNFTSRNLLPMASSGSTGTPFRYYTTRRAASLNTAAKIAAWQQAGYSIGDRYVKVAYVARPHRKQLQDVMNNSCYLQFRSPAADDMDLLLHQVAEARPTAIRTHANIAYYLAVAQLRLRLDLHPHHIFTTATTLTPAYRAAINRAFPGCDIIDAYSCEGTPCMSETPQHDGYHVCRAYGYVEFLDDEDNNVVDGLARVVSTDLWNYGHPFIRYDTHDVVELRGGVVVRIAGRANEQFVAANGRIFTGYAIGDFFTHEQKNIAGYQIVALTGQELNIRIVPDEGYDKQQNEAIVDHWQRLTGQPVKVEICSSLPFTIGGKHRTIITEQY